MLLSRLNKYQELTRSFHRDLLSDNKHIVEAQNQVRSHQMNEKMLALEIFPQGLYEWWSENYPWHGGEWRRP